MNRRNFIRGLSAIVALAPLGIQAKDATWNGPVVGERIKATRHEILWDKYKNDWGRPGECWVAHLKFIESDGEYEVTKLERKFKR